MKAPLGDSIALHLAQAEERNNSGANHTGNAEQPLQGPPKTLAQLSALRTPSFAKTMSR
jgi:hypothetical protein